MSSSTIRSPVRANPSSTRHSASIRAATRSVRLQCEGSLRGVAGSGPEGHPGDQELEPRTRCPLLALQHHRRQLDLQDPRRLAGDRLACVCAAVTTVRSVRRTSRSCSSPRRRSSGSTRWATSARERATYRISAERGRGGNTAANAADVKAVCAAVMERTRRRGHRRRTTTGRARLSAQPAPGWWHSPGPTPLGNPNLKPETVDTWTAGLVVAVAVPGAARSTASALHRRLVEHQAEGRDWSAERGYRLSSSASIRSATRR